jgi:hypothetical protein
MRNTTKLKHLLQIYNINLEMDDDIIIVTTISKRSNLSKTFEDKSYAIAMDKAFRSMMKHVKKLKKEGVSKGY